VAENIFVSLKSLLSEFSLEEIYMPQAPQDIKIICPDVNRPGLPIAGYVEHFESERIQILGNAETHFLETMDSLERRASLRKFMSKHPVAVVVTRSLEISDELMETSREYAVPLLRTKDKTSSFMAALIAYLSVSLAPRITRPGVFVEVYGEGILIMGDSGIGKSETAIELVKRGHRLIADDAVEIKRVSAKTLVGSAPEIIRYYVELRGIGVVDIRRLFGMGAVKDSEKIDIVIKLEPWKEGKMYDRLGLENEKTEILGIEIPTLTIPVRPGRNLAIILEIAAMNHRQKRMGYNTAQELEDKLKDVYENIDDGFKKS